MEIQHQLKLIYHPTLVCVFLTNIGRTFSSIKQHTTSFKLLNAF